MSRSALSRSVSRRPETDHSRTSSCRSCLADRLVARQGKNRGDWKRHCIKKKSSSGFIRSISFERFERLSSAESNDGTYITLTSCSTTMGTTSSPAPTAGQIATECAAFHTMADADDNGLAAHQHRRIRDPCRRRGARPGSVCQRRNGSRVPNGASRQPRQGAGRPHMPSALGPRSPSPKGRGSGAPFDHCHYVTGNDLCHPERCSF
jgi:hypothetical protein